MATTYPMAASLKGFEFVYFKCQHYCLMQLVLCHMKIAFTHDSLIVSYLVTLCNYYVVFVGEEETVVHCEILQNKRIT
ncbi:hypothetical protein T12_16591 [Trichinella patagoniensis]|uniref:Uncharacterized protein n=1 Tax=Trichinella patagoniensis TaxID=990121 RepID=A0A0V0ZWE7_9BILA|nr:hypothetical protein T12_16591 [Trichinella patagoniensis]